MIRGTSWASRRRSEFGKLDAAVYAAIAATRTPNLDRDFSRLSRAANHSKIWMAAAAVMALTGPRGQRAAVDGLSAVAATSAVVNLGVKPLANRRRPDRLLNKVPLARQVRMPGSTSFPSGHSASAFAFASAASDPLPAVSGLLQLAAASVAYSRVHTGVHYPVDAIAGSLIGSAVAPLTTAALNRWRERDAPDVPAVERLP
jgi:membrane-associated phospholipid phosphatase